MECCLAQGGLVKLEGGKETLTIRCTAGCVWLPAETLVGKSAGSEL